MRKVQLMLKNPGWISSEYVHILPGLPGPSDCTDLSSLSQWTGHFALIEMTENSIKLSADRMRSFPLFYIVNEAIVRVTDDALTASKWAKSIDAEAKQEFAATGFVTGHRTLFSNVFQIEAGTTTTIDLETGLINFDYWGLSVIADPTKTCTDENIFDQQLETAVRSSLERLLKQVGNRRLVLPLSGGLDSRLLVAHLKLLGVSNVTCFTYGRPGANEINFSKKVAEAAGYEWHVVHYTPETVKRIWDSPQTAEWMQASWSCSALPHPQDYVALVYLLEQKLIPADSVILPGHTVVGNMHDEDLLSHCSVDSDFLKDLILKHHFILAGKQIAIPKASRIVIDNLFNVINYSGNPQSVREAIENYNLRERQAKYINNSARTYDFLGLGWSYPMIDTEVYNCWTYGCLDLTATRDAYARHVERLFEKATGKSLALHKDQTIRVEASTKAKVEKLLRTVHLYKPASHIIQLWNYRHHPLGFNLIIRGNFIENVIKTIRLDPILGRWAKSFLNDSWGPKHHIFDRFRKK